MLMERPRTYRKGSGRGKPILFILYFLEFFEVKKLIEVMKVQSKVQELLYVLST